jgi:hypothetical protein
MLDWRELTVEIYYRAFYPNPSIVTGKRNYYDKTGFTTLSLTLTSMANYLFRYRYQLINLFP